MGELFFLVLSISTTIFVILESKRSKKRMEKYIEECNTRIEWFKNNMGLTSELQGIKVSIDLLSDYPFAFSGDSIDEDIE